MDFTPVSDDARLLEHPSPVGHRFWGAVASGLNIFHVVLGVVMMFGGFLLPPRFLGVLIISNLIMLARVHDYCYFSEATALAEEWGRGCREEFNFSEITHGLVAEAIGFRITPHLLSNFSIAMTAISAIVALARLALHYHFPIIPNISFFIFVLPLPVLLLVYEIYAGFFYEPMPFCSV